MQTSNVPPTLSDLFHKGQELLFRFEKDKTLNEDQRKKCLDDAELIFSGILNDKKECDLTAFSLASVYTKKSNFIIAELLLKEALRLRKDFLDAINNLGYCYKVQNRTIEARHEFDKVLRLIKDKKIKEENKIDKKQEAEFICNLGSTYIAIGDPKKALEILDKSIEVDSDCAIAKWNRSLAYLEMGNYEKGFEEYEFGERIARTKERVYNLSDTPFWDGTPGKTVAVYGEQGIGDELMFATILPDLMNDCNVVLDAHPRLADLFRRSFPTVPVYGTRKTSTVKPYDLEWTKFQGVDAKLSIGSLGKFYRKKTEDFPGTPYLKADPKLITKHNEKLMSLGPRKKIGISWRGGTTETNKNTRKIPMDLLLPLLEVDADFISLQYDKNIGYKIKTFEDKNNVKLNHWQDVLDDYDETAALVSNLDLIISVPQSVVHLAGSLGVPTLQLCPKKALWQMGPYGENMPWYSCIENIWQEKEGEWESVLQKAKEKLCSLLQTSIAA